MNAGWKLGREYEVALDVDDVVAGSAVVFDGEVLYSGGGEGE